MLYKSTPLIALAIVLTGCASGERQVAAPGIAETVDSWRFSGASGATDEENFLIGPADKLSVRVLQVPDLSFEEIFVDAAGHIQMPLMGPVRAAGRTPQELSTEIQNRLGERYLRNPQVSVTVLEAASQKVTVDGAVKKPGVYEMRGRTTLLQAVAMAEGATNIASLDSVAVFRIVDGRRMVAVFDLGAIRGGQSADPVVYGDDIIVVDTSRLSAGIREVLQALPGLAFFAYI